MPETRKYILRVVVPARDLKRVEKALETVKTKGCLSFYSKRIKHFDVRRDLDSLEFVYLLVLSRDDERKLREMFSRILQGTIGFFLLYVVE
ncbi:MAG: hypothetical protein J7L38_04025 [Thermoproteales archaeon]|nr:hypothetical protein [Thermoproteales archaeon]RLE67296.1 MAG: hypothetical protein DRJ47_00290 [Thermoprotei archaeon]